MDHYHFLNLVQISELKSEQSKTKNTVNLDMDVLTSKFERLNLYVLALGELLEDLGVSKEAVEKKIEEIDLRDGKLDGTFTEVSVCSSCNRKTSKLRPYCMYCGASF